ncbi:MAG TPA: hypothetical protein VIX19_15335, partial [Terriglobales bacterium]
MKKQKAKQRISRRVLGMACVVLLLGTLPGFGGDRAGSTDSSSNDSNTTSANSSRDVSSADMKGIPKHYRYYWAMAGGAALGAGVGALLPPGSGTSATKG